MGPTPHDSFFAYTFRDPARARQLLQAALPADLATAIDWDTLVLLPASFVDEALRGQFADLLFSAKCGDQSTLIYVLIEHKSGTGPRVAFQMLRYVVRIWEQWARDDPSGPLPPVLPIVVHHGRTAWTGPTTLRPLIDQQGIPPVARDLLLALQPELRVALFDLAGFAEADLQQLVDDGFARLTILCLQRLRGAEAGAGRELLTSWIRLVAGLRRRPDGLQAFAALCSWILAATDLQADDLITVLTPVLDREMRDIIHHYGKHVREAYFRGVDDGMEKGIEKGLEQGIEKGVALGRALAKADALHELLVSRFGPLPDDLEQRLRCADLPTLDHWLGGLFQAGSARELLGG